MNAEPIKCKACGAEMPPHGADCQRCGAKSQTEPTNYAAPKIKDPGAANACQCVGTLSVIVGPLLIIAGFSDLRAPDVGSGIATGLAILISSIFWFALARVIILLAHVEHNTRGR